MMIEWGEFSNWNYHIPIAKSVGVKSKIFQEGSIQGGGGGGYYGWKFSARSKLGPQIYPPRRFNPYPSLDPALWVS